MTYALRTKSAQSKKTSIRVIRKAETSEIRKGTKERPRLTEEERIQVLNDDEWAAAFNAKRVLCSGCGIILKLDQRNDYYTGLWTKHKGRCAAIREVYHSMGMEVPREWACIAEKYGKRKTPCASSAAASNEKLVATRDFNTVETALILVKDFNKPVIPPPESRTSERMKSHSVSPLLGAPLKSPSPLPSQVLENTNMTSAEQFAIRWLALPPPAVAY